MVLVRTRTPPSYQKPSRYFYLLDKWVRTSSWNLFSKTLSITSFIEESGLTSWSGSSWEEPVWYLDGLNLTCLKTHTRGESGGMSGSHSSDWKLPWRPSGTLHCVSALYCCCPQLPVWAVMPHTAPATMSMETHPVLAQRQDTRRTDTVDTNQSPSLLYQLWAGSGTMLRPPTWWPSGSWLAGSANWVSPDPSVPRLSVCLSSNCLSSDCMSINSLFSVWQSPDCLFYDCMSSHCLSSDFLSPYCLSTQLGVHRLADLPLSVLWPSVIQLSIPWLSVHHLAVLPDCQMTEG